MYPRESLENLTDVCSRAGTENPDCRLDPPVYNQIRNSGYRKNVLVTWRLYIRGYGHTGPLSVRTETNDGLIFIC